MLRYCLVTVFSFALFSTGYAQFDDYRYSSEYWQMEDLNRNLDRIANAAEAESAGKLRREMEQGSAYYQAELAWQQARQVQMQAAQQLTLAANYIGQLEKIVLAYRKEYAKVVNDNRILVRALNQPNQQDQVANAPFNRTIPADLRDAYIRGDEQAVDDLLRKYIQQDAKATAKSPALAVPRNAVPQDNRKRWISSQNYVRFALVGNRTWEEYDKDGAAISKYNEVSRKADSITLRSTTGQKTFTLLSDKAEVSFGGKFLVEGLGSWDTK